MIFIVSLLSAIHDFHIYLRNRRGRLNSGTNVLCINWTFEIYWCFEIPILCTVTCWLLALIFYCKWIRKYLKYIMKYGIISLHFDIDVKLVVSFVQYFFKSNALIRGNLDGSHSRYLCIRVRLSKCNLWTGFSIASKFSNQLLTHWHTNRRKTSRLRVTRRDRTNDVWKSLLLQRWGKRKLRLVYWISFVSFIRCM